MRSGKKQGQGQEYENRDKESQGLKALAPDWWSYLFVDRFRSCDKSQNQLMKKLLLIRRPKLG